MENKINTKNILNFIIWIIIVFLSIEAFLFRIPYTLVIGLMLLSISILFFPWLNKFISFSLKNKLFIGITNFLVATYSLKPNESNYYKCIIPATLIILSWIITIIYVKRYKNEENSKQIKRKK